MDVESQARFQQLKRTQDLGDSLLAAIDRAIASLSSWLDWQILLPIRPASSTHLNEACFTRSLSVGHAPQNLQQNLIGP